MRCEKCGHYNTTFEFKIMSECLTEDGLINLHCGDCRALVKTLHVREVQDCPCCGYPHCGHNHPIQSAEGTACNA
jgi:hypothetical protein